MQTQQTYQLSQLFPLATLLAEKADCYSAVNGSAQNQPFTMSTKCNGSRSSSLNLDQFSATLCYLMLNNVKQANLLHFRIHNPFKQTKAYQFHDRHEHGNTTITPVCSMMYRICGRIQSLGIIYDLYFMTYSNIAS